MKLPKEIKEVVVKWPGDSSVGIPDHSIIITDTPLIDFELYGNTEEENKALLEAFRTKLGEAFRVIDDERMQILFDFEYDRD